MAFKCILALLAVGATVLASPVPRDSEPFVGTGLINVVNLNNQQVGCLTSAMAFTADRSTCGTFNIVKTVFPPEPPFGLPPPPAYAISTSAGPCGEPFQSGSQYEVNSSLRHWSTAPNVSHRRVVTESYSVERVATVQTASGV